MNAESLQGTQCVDYVVRRVEILDGNLKAMICNGCRTEWCTVGPLAPRSGAHEPACNAHFVLFAVGSDERGVLHDVGGLTYLRYHTIAHFEHDIWTHY